MVLILLSIALLSNLAVSNASSSVFRTRAGTTDSVNVSESGPPPQAKAGKDLTVQINEVIHFNSSGLYDDNGIVNYSWAFEHLGKEILLYGPKPEFIFKEIGYYEVNHTVIDGEGNKTYYQMYVTVENYKEKVRVATILGIGLAGISFLGLMVWSFILEKKEKRNGSKKER